MFYMKKLFLVLISLAVVFSCKPENGGNSGENPSSGAKATVVRLGSYSMLFEAISPEAQTVKVYADGDWTVQAPEWVSVSPDHGSGTVSVTVSVLDNESKEGRTAEVVFAPDLVSTTNRLTVQQKGDNKVHIRSGQAFADWLAGLTVESLDEAYLDADIDMNGIEFTYSEGSAKGISGVLDGHGHVIKNLSGTGPLFRVNKGTLKNIVIDESCSFEPDTLVFGVLASRNEGIIEDCINKASVIRRIAPTTSKSNLIAGIVGMSVAKDENVVNLTGCKNYGNVSILVNDDGKFTSQGVAGVVAYALDEVVSCENYGEITLSGGYHTNRACPARDPADQDNIEAGEFFFDVQQQRIVELIEGELDALLGGGRPLARQVGRCGFEFPQLLFGPIDDVRRHAGQPGDMDAETVGYAAGAELPQEDDLSVHLLDGDMEVVDARVAFFQLVEFVVVGGEKGLGPGTAVEILHDGPGDGHAVESAGATADLVKQDE